jgi:hypothetical protein
MLFVMKNPIFQGKNIHSLLQGRIPGQLVIQYTNACNATCPQCSMRKSMIYARSKISEEEIYKIIDSAEKQKIQALSFTGGEPFLYKEELLRLLNYASKRDIPYLRTGTNGFLFMNSQSSDFTDRMHRLPQMQKPMSRCGDFLMLSGELRRHFRFSTSMEFIRLRILELTEIPEGWEVFRSK